MNKRLDAIRTRAIEIREKLSYSNPDEQKNIAMIEKIIRGAVLVKWMHLLAGIFFFFFAVIFTYLMYPDAKAMVLMLGFAAGGYIVSRLGIMIQIKLYDRSIYKAQSTLST